MLWKNYNDENFPWKRLPQGLKIQAFLKTLITLRNRATKNITLL